MIDEFRAFISIYQTGKELSDKNVWRNRARLANIFTILISAIFMVLHGLHPNFNVDQTTIGIIGAGLAAGVSAFNSWVHSIPVGGVPSVGESGPSGGGGQ